MTKTFLMYVFIIGCVALVCVAIIRYGNSRNIREVDNGASVGQASDTQEEIDNKKEKDMENTYEKSKAVITTNMGVIEIELWEDLAPQTVENFEKLAKNNFYDGVRFHRVIEGFMIQSGDPLSKDIAMIDRWGTGGPGYTFSDEIHEQNNNLEGTISMANAGPNTNGSQFFINVADNSYLDDRHTVFGKVVSGYDVVEKISLVDTIPEINRPVEDVIIEKVEIQ